MQYVLLNKNKDYIVEHILKSECLTGTFNKELYPDYYYIYEDENDIVNGYNLKLNIVTNKFEVIDGVESFTSPYALPDELTIVKQELELTQNALNEIIMGGLI